MRPEERDPAHLWDMLGAARRVSSRFREYAVAHPTAKKSLFIWTNIAVKYSTCIQGVVEKSKRKTRYLILAAY